MTKEDLREEHQQDDRRYLKPTKINRKVVYHNEDYEYLDDHYNVLEDDFRSSLLPDIELWS